MLDPIEMMERAAEDWYYENVQPGGRMKCSCGRVYNLEDGCALSDNPYAIPVCPECACSAHGEGPPG